MASTESFIIPNGEHFYVIILFINEYYLRCFILEVMFGDGIIIYGTIWLARDVRGRHSPLELNTNSR
jgi:hypothetical protein